MEQFLEDEPDTDKAKAQSCIFDDNGAESAANIRRYCVRKHYISKKTGCVNTDVFECKICHKKMRQLCNFKSHLRVHLNLKPFKCPTCGKGFATRSNCNHHMKKAVCSRRYFIKAK